MENQMKQFSSKDDINKMAGELRAGIDQNTARIDKLFELRRQEEGELEKRWTRLWATRWPR